MLWIVVLALILAAAAVGGYYYGKGSGEPVQATAKEVTGRARGWVGKLLRRKPGPEQYGQWLAEAPLQDRKKLYQGLPKDAEAFQTWLAGLAPQEARVFGQRVSRFAAGFGIEPAWLTSSWLESDPELKAGLEDAVALYGLADWRANEVQADLQALVAFEGWLARPSRHKELGQKLFVRLVEEGAVEMPAELITAKKKERRAYMEQAIRDYADKDRAALYATLEEVLSGTAEEAAPAEVAAPAEEPPAEKPPRSQRRKPKAEAEPEPTTT